MKYSVVLNMYKRAKKKRTNLKRIGKWTPKQKNISAVRWFWHNFCRHRCHRESLASKQNIRMWYETSLASYSTITRYYNSFEEIQSNKFIYFSFWVVGRIIFAEFNIHEIDAAHVHNSMWFYCFEILIVVLSRPCFRIESTDWMLT